MSIYRLIYVSDSLLGSDAVGSDVAQIKSAARARNNSLAISGALLLCRGRFVGTLEGERTVVTALMAHIGRDPRHARAATLSEGLHDARIFADWSFAYAGRSLFVAAMIDRALSGLDDGVQRLAGTIHEFSRDATAQTAIAASVPAPAL